MAFGLADDRKNLRHDCYLRARGENRTRHLSITDRVLSLLSFAGLGFFGFWFLVSGFWFRWFLNHVNQKLDTTNQKPIAWWAAWESNPLPLD